MPGPWDWPDQRPTSLLGFLNALFRISRVDKEIYAALPCTFSADTMIYFTVNMYLDIYYGILYNEYVLGYIRSILTIELRVTN